MVWDTGTLFLMDWTIVRITFDLQRLFIETNVEALGHWLYRKSPTHMNRIGIIRRGLQRQKLLLLRKKDRSLHLRLNSHQVLSVSNVQHCWDYFIYILCNYTYIKLVILLLTHIIYAQNKNWKNAYQNFNNEVNFGKTTLGYILLNLSFILRI